MFGTMILAAFAALTTGAQGEYEHVIHPGAADGSGFWNERAKWFMYAPAFPFKSVPGAVRYRFTVTDAKGGRNVFTSDRPTTALSPVWSKVNVSDVTVVCEGVDVDGKVVGKAGERTFWKAAGFREGAYPPPAKDFGEAARGVYDYAFGMKALQHLLDTGRLDMSDPINSYASKACAGFINAMVDFAELAPENRERALAIARKAAEYLIAGAEKGDAPLAWFPQTYAGKGEGNTGIKNKGLIMLNYPASVASAFVRLHKATDEARWLDYAEKIAGTYLRLQGEDGTWFLKMRAADGRPVNPNRLVPIQSTLPMFEALFRATGKSVYREAADRAFANVERTRLADWDWEGQFEDVPPAGSKYQNLTKHDAASLAIYLGERFPGDAKRLGQMRELMRFVEDQFVCWEEPAEGGLVRHFTKWRPTNRYDQWVTPCALEQYECYWPIDASAAKVIRAYLALYKAERNPQDLAKARALGASMTRVQRPDGSIPTWWWKSGGGQDWMNCMFASARALMQLAEFDGAKSSATAGANPKPSEIQMKYLETEMMGIVHYGLNTYVDREWGFGDTPPSVLKPTALDPEQWVVAAKAGGLRRLVLVCKHHDGFCLFPSKLNSDYTIANTSWKDGKGDLVKEFREACRKHGLEFGAYLSPWDRHQANYASAAYTDYFHGQWDELMANYGPICEIWLDGANGGDGWYGGANERRKLPSDARTYYRFNALLDRLAKRYPQAIAFGGGLRPNCSIWCGNETGMNPETCWNVRDGVYIPNEADTPFRCGGWFWHPDDRPKSLAELVDVYFFTVGRNAVLDLGLAPNRDGVIGADDVARLKEFGDYIRAFNATDFAADAKRTETREGNRLTVMLKLPAAKTFNAVDLKEEIADGQTIGTWTAEAKVGGEWKALAKGTTVGSRRMERFASVEADEVRIVLEGEKGKPVLRSAALRFAPPVKPEPVAQDFEQWRSPVKLTEPAPDVRIYDLLRHVAVDTFQYRPPKDRTDGVPDKFALYASDDGATWREVMTGEFGNLRANPVMQRLPMPERVEARYFKVVALRALDGSPRWEGTLTEFFCRKKEEKSAPKCPVAGEWKLDAATSDEFDAPSFDHGKWWNFTPWWRGRREYVNRAANVVQTNGCLELWAKRIPAEEQEYEDRAQGFWPYTCGIVKSKAKVKYGYFEVRAKGTAAEVRNAFWLYDPLSDGVERPWSKYACGSHSEEIDIYEFVGKFQDEAKKRPYRICAAVHRFETPYVEGVVNAYQTSLLRKNGARDVDWRPSDDYHTYGLLWTPTELVWYVDGEAYHRRPNDHYHTPLHVMIDVEIAKWHGAEPEKLDAATLPAVHSIDYFRRWEFAETPVVPSFLRKGDVWVMSGDSITHNDFYRQVVLDALDHHHPGHGIRIMNTAVWGQLTSEAKGQGLDLRPTVVTIMLGMNNVIHRDYPPTYDFVDDAAKYAETIRVQVKGFKEQGAAVVLMKPTYSDETEYSYFNVYHTRRGLEAYGRALERIAEEEGCEIIPVAEDFEEVKCRAGKLDTFIADGVHPLGHGQYQIAKSLIERLNIAGPLGEKGVRRFVRQGPLQAAETTIVRGGNLLARRAKVPLKVTSSVAGTAKLVWSARRGAEPSVVRGEQAIVMDGKVAAEFFLDLPDAAYPARIGDTARLYVTLLQKGRTLATAIVDLGETKVYDLTSGSVSGEVPGFGRWTVETRGRDLWISGETYQCAWPARPKNDIWMNSSGMNGLQTFFDFRPADRFAENRPDHDVSMINLNVLEDPWSAMAFSWIGRRTQNCLRTFAERTEKGFTWKLGFRGRVNDYTPFDISANDFFAMQLIFQVYDGNGWRHGPIMEQYRHGQPWIDPAFFLNVSPVFDRKGDLPKPTALTVSAWTL